MNARAVTACTHNLHCKQLRSPSKLCCNAPPVNLSICKLLLMPWLFLGGNGGFMTDDQILTIEEAAQFLKMTPRQVYELCRVRSQERME